VGQTQLTSVFARRHVIACGRVTGQKARLLALFKSVHPLCLSDFEVEQRLGWRPNIVTARRVDLMKQDLVINSVESKVNPKSGFRCNGYCLTQKGLEYRGVL